MEWVAIFFSSGSSGPRDWTCISYICGIFFITEPPGSPPLGYSRSMLLPEKLYSISVLRVSKIYDNKITEFESLESKVYNCVYQLHIRIFSFSIIIILDGLFLSLSVVSPLHCLAASLALSSTQLIPAASFLFLPKGMATHSSILAWRIPWTEKLGGPQFLVSQRTGRDWTTNTHFLCLLPSVLTKNVSRFC